MFIYLMRHGETDLNRALRMQGSVDEPLNENGRAQAAAAGEKIRQLGLKFDHVITSPLDRARETAELATGMERSRFEIDPRIREMEYGPYEGKRILTLNWKVLSFLKAPYKKPAPEGIETIESLYGRVSSFLEDTAERTDANSVLVVTHGIAMRNMIGYLKGLDCRDVWKQRFSIENCAVFRTETDGNGFSAPEKI